MTPPPPASPGLPVLGPRLPLVVLAAVVLLGVAALATRWSPEATPGPARSSYAVIVGAPGLRWDDVSPSATPALWRLAAEGAVGSLAVRSASRLTCPLDGWVTLGAGNLAEWDQGRSRGPCPATRPTVIRPDPFGGRLLEQPRVVAHNRRLSWGAQPGALAESMRCTMAVGPEAAVAAARPVGRVDRYVSALPADPASALAECSLSIVDAGTVVGQGAQRANALARVDASVASVLAAVPDRSLVIVAGLADTEAPGRPHVAIARGPGFAAGWLTSASTGRAGYLQLYDVAPTALAALGQTRSNRLLAGAAARSVPGRPADLTDAVAALTDNDARAAAQREVSRVFLPLFVVASLLALAAVPPVLWRGRVVGPRGPRRVSPHLRRAAEVGLLAVALALPAALVVELVPWWRWSGGAPGPAFAAAWLAALAMATAVSTLALRGRFVARMPGSGPLGPAAIVAGAAALIVAVAVIAGSRSALGGVAGYTAVDGDRYAGIGALGLGVLLAGVFVGAGAAAQRVGRGWRPVTVALLGSAGAVLVGSPYLGADSSGAIALAAGACVAVTLAVGGLPAATRGPGERWSPRSAMARLRSPLTVMRVTVAAASGAVLAVCFAAVELSHPPGQRGAIGQLLTAIGDGTAGPALERIAAVNVTAVASSPLTVLATAGALYVFAILLQPWGGLRRVMGLYPALRAALVGLAVAAVLGGVVTGAGLVVAGAAVATALPLVTLTALRAADERAPTDLNGSAPRSSGTEPGRVGADRTGETRDTTPTSGDRGGEGVTVKSRGSLDLDLA
jgi:hypothetical protein